MQQECRMVAGLSGASSKDRPASAIKGLFINWQGTQRRDFLAADTEASENHKNATSSGQERNQGKIGARVRKCTRYCVVRGSDLRERSNRWIKNEGECREYRLWPQRNCWRSTPARA